MPDTDLMGNPVFDHGSEGDNYDRVVSIDLSDDSDDLDIEVVDDRPPEDRVEPRDPERNSEDDDFDQELHEEEIEKIGKDAFNRLRRARYEYHEERRAKEAAERMREEAVKYAQLAQQENKKLRELLAKGEEVLVSEVRSRAKSEVEKAKAELRRAFESEDQDRIVNAQTALSEAIWEARRAEDYKVEPYQDDGQGPYQPQAPQQPDERLSDWMKKNEWFTRDQRMTAVAMQIHKEIIDSGSIPVNSVEYYNKIDAEMRKTFPEKFKVSRQEGKEEPAGNGRPPRVVASANRETGSTRKRVQLTSTEVQLAKRLGLTPQQYAAQKLKEQGGI